VESVETIETVLKAITLRLDQVGTDEAATKQGIVLPILNALGWNVFDVEEVVPELRVHGGRVDYCLNAGQNKRVFLEVKPPTTDLGQHEEQILKYAYAEAAELCVLTNGVSWWLYLPMLQVEWSGRKFFVIDIKAQKTRSVAEHFVSFLARRAVESGDALRRARAMHESREKKRKISEAMPQAWRSILSEPDDLLVEIVQERVARLCGHTPELADIAAFIQRRGSQSEAAVPPAPKPRATQARKRQSPARSRYSFRKPRAVVLGSDEMPVRSWRRVLVATCILLHSDSPDRFRQLLSMHGRKRPWFSKRRVDLVAPAEVPGTGVYVETNLSAEATVQRCEQLVELCGYQKRHFRVVL